MTSERSLWHTARANLSPYGKLVRVESPTTGGGVPDVLYCFSGHTGWLELKELDAWPVRPATPIRIASLTLPQVLFLEEWHRVGGTAHLLLQIERQYLLLAPTTVRAIFERKVTRGELELLAVVNETGRFPRASVLRTLGKYNDD